MPATGYYQQKTGSPSGFALVVLLHAAVFAALILIKGPEISRLVHGATVVTFIPLDRIPDPVPPQPNTQHSITTPQSPRLTQRSRLTTPGRSSTTPIIRRSSPIPGPPVHVTEIASTYVPPVRHEARLLGNDLQPPYPASEQRAQREARSACASPSAPTGG